MARVLSLTQQNGLNVTLTELIAHHPAGGDVEGVVTGLLFARGHSISLTWTQATAIDLTGMATGKRLADVLGACAEVRTYTFDSYSPEDSEPLAGFTRDGTRVEAACTLRYRSPPQHVFGLTIERQHETLAVRIAVLINKSSDPHQLEMGRNAHEQAVLALCADAGVQEVPLMYQRM